MELGPTFNRGTKLQTSNNMNDLNTTFGILDVIQ